MNELFRFLQLRPAEPIRDGEVMQLTASFAPRGTSRRDAAQLARAFVGDGRLLRGTDELRFASAAAAVAELLAPGPQASSGIAEKVHALTGSAVAAIVGDPAFATEESSLTDSVVAGKLLSDSLGVDIAGFAEVLMGYDAIRRATTETEVGLRLLALDSYPAAPAQQAPPPPPTPPVSPEAGPNHSGVVAAYDEALARLSSVSGNDFAVTHPAPAPGAADRQHAFGGPDRPWRLTSEAVAALPAAVRSTLASAGIDLTAAPLTTAMTTLYQQRAAKLADLAEQTLPTAVTVHKLGVAFNTVAASDYVGDPTAGLSFGPSNVRPVGIGDLLLVREHVLRYEGGELAHTESVMKSEKITRSTRRLDRTETTLTQETETTNERTSDTQTTERFDLKRETSDTIKTDSQLKAGLSVDAKYGPLTEIKANTDFATSTTTESAAKQASEFSKEIVDRSTSKLTERILERQTVTTLSEFEEDYAHEFDNTAGTGHITGIYQWIDKVMEAQVFNYGRRLLFDVTVPEPGTNFVLSQSHSNDALNAITKPPEFTARASDLDEGSYLVWAKLYDATGLEPPPPPIKTYTKSFDAVVTDSPWESSKSDTLAIDDGYSAEHALFAYDCWYHSNEYWGVLIGNQRQEVFTAPQTYLTMAGELGSLPIAYDAHGVEELAATIEVFCTRTDTAWKAWQLKVHAAITQAYVAKVQAYEQALSEARAAATDQVAGQNPEFNARVVAMELRRQVLALMTGQQFDGFGALELSAEGYAQPDPARAAIQMPYVRFFEEAFEWERILYFYYPYFWGWKPGWKNKFLLDDVDPAFGDFLRAGACRVVFPVRPGFEAAVIHYLETGEIWNGGPPPDITSSMYVSIVAEIQEATNAPAGEQPVGDPWEYRLPTTLVRLRPNDDLPIWQKVGNDWQPTN